MNGNASPTIFAHVKEDWKMAVISGSPEVLSSAAQHWVDELSRGGIVTPEILNSWKNDALLFRSQLVREMLGPEADSASRARTGRPASPGSLYERLLVLLIRLA